MIHIKGAPRYQFNKLRYHREIIQPNDLDKVADKIRSWKVELTYQLTQDLCKKVSFDKSIMQHYKTNGTKYLVLNSKGKEMFNQKRKTEKNTTEDTQTQEKWREIEGKKQ